MAHLGHFVCLCMLQVASKVLLEEVLQAWLWLVSMLCTTTGITLRAQPLPATDSPPSPQRTLGCWRNEWLGKGGGQSRLWKFDSIPPHSSSPNTHHFPLSLLVTPHRGGDVVQLVHWDQKISVKVLLNIFINQAIMPWNVKRLGRVFLPFSRASLSWGQMRRMYITMVDLWRSYALS